ncbi:bifunctional DNA-formamidopyrimidine glycosylase/DNA-(apurinic or apyrimidinic site) lyase [Alkalimarinus alittae]|uniref:Formamidopyrimidine-DNA glycosylase n=1 Tax=Alkalimarinus alittae TaxID=2961619 RepID=A0ABY6N3J3_9ALTE|nr:bifunctional DNA-formamidopyrimidine glycosylase/DNA-(apurinic or apyrimidinic site) lyase [Alkalimarinus alittae]UZE96559.1 bifunctional DNA-formamidopyrimidine glycosylase/DNA-(apurinic or apyrimidinic site) lyase [Alkalimarinus alittae]
MPELPEVETTRRGIHPYVEHNTIRSVTIRERRLRWPVSDELTTLSMALVHKLERRAKYLILHLPKGYIIIHLGMSGNLRVVENNTPIGKHDHVDLNMNDGKIIRYNDPRRFGSVLWVKDWESHSLFSKLGPEPLEASFNADYLHKQAKDKTTGIKQFIMDNKNVVGVGNIYANEALFLSGIHPKRPAGKLSKKRISKFVDHIKKTLETAITQGGTTLKDFVGGDGKPGYFQQQLKVYGRGGQPCTECKTTLKEIRLGQRSTVYCPKCQH